MYDFKAEIQGTGSRSWYYILVLVLTNAVCHIAYDAGIEAQACAR